MAINIFNFRKTPTPASVNPNNGRGATNLFADEKTAYDKMLSDGISQDMANKVITERRKTLLGEITPKESLVLQKMMADGIDSKIAARAVTQNRYNKASVGQKIAKNVLDMGASGTALIAEQQANIGSILTGSDKLRQTAKNIRDIRKNDFESTIGGKIGSTTIGAGEILGGGVSTKLPGGLFTAGAIEGAVMPILEKGKDVTAGDIGKSAVIGGVAGAVGGKVIEKGLKYGTAGIKGGAEGLKKSIGRDIKGVAKLPGQILDNTSEMIARKTLGSSTGKKELFRATSPSYATLGKDKNIKNIGKNIEKADETVLKYGYKPTNTENRVQAFEGAKKKVWSQIEQARGGTPTTVNASLFADELDNIIANTGIKGKVNPAFTSDIKQLQELSDYYRGMGDIDVPDLGKLRAEINGLTEFRVQNPNSNLFNTSLKKVGDTIRKTENNIIQQHTGTKFGDLMQEYKALAEVYPDIVKANIKNMRSGGEGLTEGLSRIEGVGDVVKGTVKLVTKHGEGISDIAKGTAKTILGKSYGKLKNPDFLIEEGYKKLSKNLSINKSKNAKLPTVSNIPNSSSNSKQIVTDTTKKSILSDREKLLITNKPKNAIPNQTTKISSKDGNVTKTDVNYKNRLALLDEKERVNFLNQQERVKEGNQGFTKIGDTETMKRLKEMQKRKEIEILTREAPKVRISDEYPKSLNDKFGVIKRGLDKLKTQKSAEKYTNIETMKGKYKAFRDFYDEAKEFIESRNLDMSVQELFDKMYDSKFVLKEKKLSRILPSNFKEKAQDIVEKIADKVGARTKLLGGENARKMPTNLEKAKNWEMSGKSADDIWKETGWEKGTDGKWKFEIDDSEAKVLKTSKELDDWQTRIGIGKTLPEVIEHPTLYKQYPEIKNLRVKVDFDGNGGGSFNEVDGVITVNGLSKGLPINPEKIKSTLLHEIQHYIQSKEGFARGGSPEFMKSKIKEINKAIDYLKNDISDTQKGAKDWVELNNKIDSLPSNTDDTIFEKLENKLKKIEDDIGVTFSKKRLNELYGELKLGDEYGQYKRLAGETEARNIQSRLLKTPSERKLLRPAKTEDVARDKQIVKMDGGKSMSIGADKTALLKGSDDLISEARKYKTFDDFKKSQGEELYHGTNANFNEFDDAKINIKNGMEYGIGHYFTNDKNYAKNYGNIKKFRIYLERPYKVPEYTNFVVSVYDKFGFTPQQMKIVKKGGKTAEIQVATDILKSKGYDGVIFKSKASGNEYMVFDKSQIKTEAQLKQIYEQSKPKLLKKTSKN